MFHNTSLRDEFIVYTVVLFDFIWFSRNKIAHGSHSIFVQYLTKQAMRKSNDHWKSILNTFISARSSSNQLIGWLKINTDNSIADGEAHSSWII